MRHRIATLCALVALVGCTGGIDGSGPDKPVVDDSEAPPAEEQAFDIGSLDAGATETYLAKIAPPFVGRVLTAPEREKIQKLAGEAILPILEGWTEETGFVQAARTLVETKLSVSGTKDGVDFGMPGKIVAHVVKNKLPWSEVLTSSSCYDDADAPVECDSGAPYTAGVLTTRGYLMSRASRFNLTRSSTLMRAFACRGYPQEDELQPRIDKARLIPMFQALTPEEQTEEKAKGGFGNGFGCYTCHGQFSVHAQLYVKFDSSGLWQADASGEQDPEGELGRSYNGLMASHLIDPLEAAKEDSQIFGVQVKNLAEAAAVVAHNPVFVQCAARNALEYGLLLDPSIDIDPKLMEQIAEQATLTDDDPTFGAIVVATFTDPDVVRATLSSLTGEMP